MKKYTLESLKAINPSYDFEHRVTQQDVDKVNAFVEIIEQGRSKEVPKVGDVVEFTNKHGDYYNHAHIESIDGDQLYICERPYSPFVETSVTRNGFYTSTSGGAWTYVPKNLEYVGKKEKAFVVWGHGGARGNGAVTFFAEVSVWTYTQGSPTFTTRTHDKFYVSIPNDVEEYGYKFIVRKGGESHRAFRTEKEYHAWLKTYHGIEQDGHTPNSKIVWTYKQKSKCVPLEEYHQVQGAVIDSELCNATIQECKRIYEGTSVTTFLPYQNDKIALGNVREHMRAYQS